MKTYRVPVFFDLEAENMEEAQALVLAFMEYAMEVGNDDEALAAYIGRLEEIMEVVE
jgi:hypothetical protein